MAAIALEYARRSEERDAMVLAVGDDRHTERLVVANGDRAALFKIQTTATKTLRVRPALAHLPPHARVEVRIHLSSSQEHTPRECKLLVLVRAADDASDAISDSSSNSESVMERELKERWKRAEQRNVDSLLFSETIKIHVVARVVSPLPVGAVPASSRAGTDSSRSLHIQSVPMMSRGGGPTLARTDSSLSTSRRTEPTEYLHVEEPPTQPAATQLQPIAMSTEHLARLIVLLMKNQSARVANRLSAAETTALERVRAASSAEQWTRWCEYAYRMRVLVREQHRRQPRTS